MRFLLGPRLGDPDPFDGPSSLAAGCKISYQLPKRPKSNLQELVTYNDPSFTRIGLI
jgi:hypothetical protein